MRWLNLYYRHIRVPAVAMRRGLTGCPKAIPERAHQPAVRYRPVPALDEDGDELDILVQSRRNRQAAIRFFRKVLKVRIPDDREHRFQSNVNTESGHREQRFR